MAVEFDEQGQAIAASGNPEAHGSESTNVCGTADPANPTSEALQQLLATADEHAQSLTPSAEAASVEQAQPLEAVQPVMADGALQANHSPESASESDQSSEAQAAIDCHQEADTSVAAQIAPIVMNADSSDTDDAEPILEESPALEATLVLEPAMALNSTTINSASEGDASQQTIAQSQMDATLSLPEQSPRRVARDWEQRLSAARDFGMMAVRSALNVRQTLSAMSLVLRQTDVIFSGRHSQGTGRARPEINDGRMIVRIPADQMQQAGGVFAPAPPPQGALLATVGEPATILFFYDGASSVAQSMTAVNKLRSLGCNVLCVDYIGYGMSSGIPSEKSCYATAEAALDYLLSREDIDRRHIIACGHRMGAAVAVELAVRRHLSGVILIHPFTCMVDAIRQSMSDIRFPLPLKHRFDCEARISRVQCPILLAHHLDASLETQADPDQPDMIQRLFMAAHAPICPVALDAPDSDSADAAGITDQLIHEAKAFIAELPPADPEINPLRPTLLLPPKVPMKSRAQTTSAPRIREAC